MAKKEYGSRKKYHFIYKTVNLVNQRYYFGMHSTNDINDGYLGSGTYLRRSIVKYGKENFKIEILEFCNSREELVAKEKEIVTLQEITKKECMNLKPGGKGGFANKEHAYKFHAAGGRTVRRLHGQRHNNRMKTDPEYRIKISQKISETQKGRPGTFKGRKHTPETISKMCQSKKDHGKGSRNSQYGSCWITNEIQNRKIKKGNPLPEGWRLGRKVKLS